MDHYKAPCKSVNCPEDPSGMASDANLHFCPITHPDSIQSILHACNLLSASIRVETARSALSEQALSRTEGLPEAIARTEPERKQEHSVPEDMARHLFNQLSGSKLRVRNT